MSVVGGGGLCLRLRWKLLSACCCCCCCCFCWLCSAHVRLRHPSWKSSKQQHQHNNKNNELRRRLFSIALAWLVARLFSLKLMQTQLNSTQFSSSWLNSRLMLLANSEGRRRATFSLLKSAQNPLPVTHSLCATTTMKMMMMMMMVNPIKSDGIELLLSHALGKQSTHLACESQQGGEREKKERKKSLLRATKEKRKRWREKSRSSLVFEVEKCCIHTRKNSRLVVENFSLTLLAFVALLSSIICAALWLQQAKHSHCRLTHWLTDWLTKADEKKRKSSEICSGSDQASEQAREWERSSLQKEWKQIKLEIGQ